MDVDIDFPTTFDPLDYFDEAIRASMVNKDAELIKHPAGVYFQSIPQDSLTKLAAIPYKTAEELGYFKFDFLHLSLLDYFESKDEIRELIKIEPDWMLLESAVHVQKLFQLSKHYDVVSMVKPKTVQELADCIALIRPGKRFLLNAYIKDRNAVRKELYRKDEEAQYYFKKSHAISYALTIVLQLHLIKGKVL